MFIPDPDIYPPLITDPGPRIQQQQTFLCSHTIHKIENYSFFELVPYHTEKFEPIYKNLLSFKPKIFVTRKLLLSCQKYGLGIQDTDKLTRDPDPGVKKAPVNTVNIVRYRFGSCTHQNSAEFV
jgi:hypothetical protein